MNKIIVNILKYFAAIVLLQTLFFKFTAHPESVQLFTEIGMEPYGRILIGVVELIASILLIIPRTTLYGAIVSAGVMVGAIMGHITKLGFAGDRLSLGILAFLVFFSCVAIVFMKRKDLPLINNRVSAK